MHWNNFSIRLKLLLFFILVVLLSLIPGGIRAIGLQKSTENTLKHQMLTYLSNIAKDCEHENLNLRRFEKDFLLAIGDIQTQEKYLLKYNAHADTLHRTIDTLKKVINDNSIVLSDEIKMILDDLEKNYNTYLNGSRDVFARIKTDSSISPSKANLMMEEYKEANHQYSDNIAKISSFASQLLDENSKLILTYNNKSRIISSTISIVAFLVAILISVLFSNSFSKKLKNVFDNFTTIAEGDFTKRISFNGNDDIGQISGRINDFSEKLQNIIGNIRNNANTVASSASELSVISTQIATNAQNVSNQSSTAASASEQATTNIQSISSSAEEMSNSANSVAIAIEEMNATLNEVAKNCQKELQIATEANTQAQNCKEIMDKLNVATRSVGKVVEIINDIADQTNLLALNATIESASAGEAGKGFAVVASEVKELARQTAEATQEIGTQIKDMQTNATLASNAIQLVTNVISEVNNISHAIVSAVEEQSATINEISRNVGNVSSGAQDVSRNVNESAQGLHIVSKTMGAVSNDAHQTSQGISQINTSAIELAKLSETLKQLLGSFKI